MALLAGATLASGAWALAADIRLSGERADVICVTARDAAYKERSPGVAQAVLWGDPELAAYGSFMRYDAGFKEALHSHANDLRIVVLKGSLIYESESGTRIRIGPESYLFIPAGTKHSTEADPKEGCTFLEMSRGALPSDGKTPDDPNQAKSGQE